MRAGEAVVAEPGMADNTLRYATERGKLPAAADVEEWKGYWSDRLQAIDGT